jgi:serine/threonine protein kinase
VRPDSASIDPVTDKRFELIRPLGQGATGAVFLARDRESGEQVALKKLFKLDQKSVQRFKREFRSLADITHPNLVKLYDLHRGQEAWFIVMEYVSGRDFRQHFGSEFSLSSENLPKAANTNAESSLVRVFHDLACGVHAIHRAGMLHRDLKPSNVLISDEGRVVVLDFGLVREIEGSTLLTQEGMIAGTPAYMPPEQATGATLSEASDWYAFGVMLYEAISGVLPIDGKNATALMQRKISHDPPPLRSGAPQVVLDLCMALLDRTPERRPLGTRVLEALAAPIGNVRDIITTQEQALTIEPAAASVMVPLFGREHELEQLRAASENLEARSLVVHVRGTSGSGKSALVEHFLDDAAASGLTPPVILRSRCYER